MPDEIIQPETTVTAAEGTDAPKPEAVDGAATAAPTSASSEATTDTVEDATGSTDTIEDATGDETLDEAADETAPDETEAANDYVEKQADLLRTADPTRFEALTARFVSDEPFEDADVSWIGEVTGHDEATVRYGLSLQRVAFKSEQTVDTSLEDAAAEFGDLDALIGFAKATAPAAKLSEWQTVADFAKRTGDSAMTRNLLSEMKAFKDSIPGNKPKTLGHLASAQAAATKPPVTPEVTPAATEAVETDALLQQLLPLSTQVLASIASNQASDPAARARATAILQARGAI